MTVRSVERAVKVLSAVIEASEPVSLTDVASKTGLPVATTKRFLDTLTKTLILSKRGRLYSPGIRLFEIGKKTEQRMDLVPAAMPYLVKLRDNVGESANLAILDKTDVVYLASVESPRMMRTFTVPGARIPAHCTGVGKILLSGHSDDRLRKLYESCVQGDSGESGDSQSLVHAKLERFTSNTIDSVDMLIREIKKARRLGYATDEGEREEGVVCIAAPVRDYSGSIVAAVSISGPAYRLDRDGKLKARAYVVKCGQDISRSLGGTSKGENPGR
ncbi:MAG: IclR family transcriptional regulator [Bacillota bacterium]